MLFLCPFLPIQENDCENEILNDYEIYGDGKKEENRNENHCENDGDDRDLVRDFDAVFLVKDLATMADVLPLVLVVL